jgi:hypothetical protein
MKKCSLMLRSIFLMLIVNYSYNVNHVILFYKQYARNKLTYIYLTKIHI